MFFQVGFCGAIPTGLVGIRGKLSQNVLPGGVLRQKPLLPAGLSPPWWWFV
jgi:hypothetical protein